MTEKHEVKNQELHDRLRDLVVKAFTLLAEKQESGSEFEFITIVEGGLVIGGKGELNVFPEGRECRRKPDFALFIFQYRDELEQLPEWKAAVECLSRDSVIHRQLTGQLVSPFGGVRLDLLNLLGCIVNMSIDEEKPFRFTLEVFDAVYEEVERYFYGDSVVRKSICPLLGFSCEVEEIFLDKEVKIRRISTDEILDLWNHSVWFRALVEGEMAFSIHAPLQYLIELSVEARKTAPTEKVEVPSATTVFDKVVSALRLFKEGWVSYPFILERQVSRLAPSTSYGRSGSLPSIPMCSYLLEKEEVENFKTFYTEIEGKLDHSRIAHARFNQTYRRERLAPQIYEDRIIDYCIAFESLFCGEDTRQKGEIISVGASMLLGKDNRDRKGIGDCLRKAYQVRNDIVHASLSVRDSMRKRKVDDDVGTFVQEIENYLRLCIKRLSGIQYKRQRR